MEITEESYKERVEKINKEVDEEVEELKKIEKSIVEILMVKLEKEGIKLKKSNIENMVFSMFVKNINEYGYKYRRKIIDETISDCVEMVEKCILEMEQESICEQR